MAHTGTMHLFYYSIIQPFWVFFQNLSDFYRMIIQNVKMYSAYFREYKIEIRDKSFGPPILVIEEGDRIWWFWDKNKVCFSVSLYASLKNKN